MDFLVTIPCHLLVINEPHVATTNRKARDIFLFSASYLKPLNKISGWGSALLFPIFCSPAMKNKTNHKPMLATGFIRFGQYLHIEPTKQDLHHISTYILLTVLDTFPTLLTRRVYITNKSFSSW